MTEHEPVPSLVEDLRAYYRGERASFHMPGHKQLGGVHPLTREVLGDTILRADVSEMGGFDYLHSPTGSLRRAQDRAAEVFKAGRTFFLVNGSTGGNLAAITAYAGDGDHVLMLRGSHRSVYTGTVLAGAVPHYIPMSYDAVNDGWFLAEPPARADLPERLAVIHITRPNYYGMACDLAPYVDLADQTGAVLIVDEAHGSHFGFHPSLPSSALAEGADIVIQSTHKTLSALTQSSMLHVRSGSSADPARMSRSLAMLQSSSPSVLLTLSLDLAAEHLRGDGERDIARAVDLSLHARAALQDLEGISIRPVDGGDPTKVVIDVSGLGHSGFSAAQWLIHNERIHIELADFRRIVCSLTVGDSLETCAILIGAIRHLAAAGTPEPSQELIRVSLPAIPPSPLTPRAALNHTAEPVPIHAAEGRTCAEYVIPYPPGIPLVVPGETLTADVLGALHGFRKAGSKVVGPDDQSGRTLLVTPR
jgi:arginine decarboxylase